MRTRQFALVTLAALAAGNAAHGQDHPWERQVRDNLHKAATSLAERGFKESGPGHVGLLLAQESDSFAVTLPAGRSYALIGVCDDDCAVLDLDLYGAGDTQLAAERGTNVPIIRVTPLKTLRYRVKVVMDTCRMNPCWYGLAVLKTEAP